MQTLLFIYFTRENIFTDILIATLHIRSTSTTVMEKR